MGITMLKIVHDRVNRWITWLKRNRRIVPETRIVKVNLGSGMVVAPGWINIEGHLRAFFSTWPAFVLNALYSVIQASKDVYTRKDYCRILKNNRFLHHDLRYGIPFADRTIDFLYSSHLLEHLHCDEGERLIREGYRVLKKGGVFRVCVPDLAYALSLFQKGEKVRALQYFFSDSEQDQYTYHRYLYDFELLKKLMTGCGFSKVVRCSFQKGRTPDIGLLDNRPEETLFVEAVK
jgi:SAM-dependent methyltransferase